MPISLTQNTLIYSLPRAGKKHAWVFWNKTGQPLYDLWIRTGASPLTPEAMDQGIKVKAPRIKKIELSKVVDGHKQVLANFKPDNATMVKVFGPTALHMDAVIGTADRDAFLAYVRSNKKDNEISKVLDDIGTHLWTLWEWIGEYTENKGVGQLARAEEMFSVRLNFYQPFKPGQWIEFIPVDEHGYTINSSNRVDERAIARTGVILRSKT